MGEKPFQVLLKVLEEKEGGCVRVAADRLTQFVQDVYDGKTFSQSFVFEEVNDLDIRQLDSSGILELCGCSPAGEQPSTVIVNLGS